MIGTIGPMDPIVEEETTKSGRNDGKGQRKRQPRGEEETTKGGGRDDKGWKKQ